MLKKSGLPRLLHVIDGTFANCADQIKAGQTLAAVTRLSYQADHASGRRARVMIETLRAEPGMHSIQELWALQQCARPDLDLPEWVITGLARVAAEATVSSKTGLPEGVSAQEVLEAARAGAFACPRIRSEPEHGEAGGSHSSNAATVLHEHLPGHT